MRVCRMVDPFLRTNCSPIKILSAALKQCAVFFFLSFPQKTLKNPLQIIDIFLYFFYNDNDESFAKIVNLAKNHKCVDKVEILPFRKICQIKYDKLGWNFRFASIPEPTRESVQHFEQILKTDL